MKAAVVVSPDHLEIREVARPEPSPYEALVKIEACGLCGTTDRHIVEGRQAHHPADWYPAILGHESLGRVLAVGPEVRKFRVGDRVTRPVAIWPGQQRDGLYSAWGGFAEYGIVREGGLPGGPEADYNTARQHVVPEFLSVEDAVLAISVSEVASWMNKLGDLSEKSVAIGGAGFAACVMAQCARAAGAKSIIGVARRPEALVRLRQNGATHEVPFGLDSASLIRVLLSAPGADWFLDAAGSQEVFEKGLTWLKPGGQAAIYGAPEGFSYRLPLGAVGGDFAVHYLAPADDIYFQQACEAIRDHKIDPSLLRSHVWESLEDLPRALTEQKSGQVLKGLVRIS